MNREREIELIDKLGADGLARVKASERSRLVDIDIGNRIPSPVWVRPCRVRILMVVDNGVSYNQYYFGLSEVLDTLRTNPEFWVEFEVTRAHRGSDPNPPDAGTPADTLYGPHHENFRFDQPGFDLDHYHQVWFYGFESGPNVPHALDDGELEILYRWMNERDGGVFATGDHENLGEALCSRIPRVRNMRHWSFPPAPDNQGLDRHDTLVPGRDYGPTANDESQEYTFDDESDDIPMRIRLRKYPDWSWWWPHFKPTKPWFWYKTSAPHPVLCGSDGPIDVLPDHPHEGEVVVPRDLTDAPGFGGYKFPEYPDFGSQPLSPEIIAWARVQDDHEVGDFKGPVNPKEFGAVGAYDGHRVGVGRVIVDSTWHHWFDVNLTGRMVLFSDQVGNIETGDPRKENGFLDTPEGVQALDRIRNYYRNVAIWLAPPDLIRCMAFRALWGSILRYPLREELSPRLTPIIVGRMARDVIGRRAGQCTIRSFWPLIIDRFQFMEKLDPDLLVSPIPELEDLGDAVLGGVVLEMLRVVPEYEEAGKTPDDDALDHLAERGARRALADARDSLERSVAASGKILDLLDRTVRD